MTDSELLNLAARAAGYKVSNRLGGGGLMVMSQERKSPHKWNPLEDDGDALRLAVKLGFGISIPLAAKRTDVVSFDCIWINAIEAHGDQYKATRRAIVRAAAIAGDKK